MPRRLAAITGGVVGVHQVEGAHFELAQAFAGAGEGQIQRVGLRLDDLGQFGDLGRGLCGEGRRELAEGDLLECVQGVGRHVKDIVGPAERPPEAWVSGQFMRALEDGECGARVTVLRQGLGEDHLHVHGAGIGGGQGFEQFQRRLGVVVFEEAAGFRQAGFQVGFGGTCGVLVRFDEATPFRHGEPPGPWGGFVHLDVGNYCT